MIKLSKSSISRREQEAALRVLSSEYLGMGQEVKSFEQEISSYLSGTPVVCVNTGTSALQLALEAVGVSGGDEVLVPTITYVASYQAISATGAVPISCDVSLNNCLIDLQDAAKRITPKTKAIMIVHYASYPGDLDEIYKFAKLHNLRVIEDAAHAFGCTYKGKKIGTIGDVVCFSFDGIKNITSGEGGAVVSHDSEVISYIQDARLLGVERDTEARYSNKRSWDFDVKIQGWRYHMSDLMAAIGRVQLSRFDREFKPKRLALSSYYRSKLAGIKGVKMFETDLKVVVPHIMPVRILNGRRDQVKLQMNQLGIQTGVHYKPNHLLSKYKSSYPLSAAEQIYTELLTLPMHVDLSYEDIDVVVSTLAHSLNKAPVC